MKKSLVNTTGLILAMCLVLTACSSSGNQNDTTTQTSEANVETNEAVTSTEMNSMEVVEDQEDMEDQNLEQDEDTNDLENETNQTTLVKVKEEGDLIYYEGEITVSGEYREWTPNTLLGGNLCFYADEETGYLVPRDPNLWGEGHADQRIPWFCFSDQESAKEMFGVSDEIFEDAAVECIEGSATVRVSNYIVNKKETATFDKADLEELVSKSEYEIGCM